MHARRALAVGLTVAGGAAGVSAAPAAAATKPCGTVKGAPSAIKITRVTTTSGGCAKAKAVAKAFVQLRHGDPAGYSCPGRSPQGRPGAFVYRVTCKRPGRTVTFRVTRPDLVLPPAGPAPPVVGGS
ncbi:MAG: hypothetical protein JWO90_2302 [Solirubrobacterales bacterium]|jgi:hypothetical protein|nr:hypothetical protein [Solirubrobacterales bacterium]